MKKRDNTINSVIAKYPWAKKALLVRLGGCYAGGSSAVLNISGESIIQLSTNPNGLILLSFVLKSPNGTVLACMNDNSFQFNPRNPHDIQCNASQTRIKIWFAPRDIGLDLSFKRLTMDGLNDILKEDKEMAENHPTARRVRKEIDKMILDLPGSVKDQISKGIQSRSPDSERFSKNNVEAHHNIDPKKNWILDNCLDEEGTISLIDFSNLSIHNAGRHIRIRNGIKEGQGTFLNNFALGNGAAAFNL